MGVLGSQIANRTVLPLSLALPLWAAPVPARFCPPQQASLPTSSRLSAHLSSPLPASLPSISVRFMSLANKNPGADAPSEAGVGLFASAEWCSDGLTFAFFWGVGAVGSP